MDNDLHVLIDAVNLCWGEWFHTAQKIVTDGPAPRLVAREGIIRSVALQLTDRALAAVCTESDPNDNAISGCGTLAGNCEDVLASLH